MRRDGVVIQAALAKGRETPPWANEPPKFDGDDFYLSAWSQLSTCRPAGDFVGPIPWVAIREYAKHYQLEEDVAEVFIQSIIEMDAGFLDIERKAAEQRRAEAEVKAKSQARRSRHG